MARQPILIKISGDAESFKRTLRDVQRESKGLEDALKTTAKVSGVAFAGFTAAIIGTSNAAREQIRVERRTLQAIESTGGAAGRTAEEIFTLGDSLQAVTNFTAGATIAAQNMLLQFNEISNETFPRVTELALDMAEAMGTDAASAAEILGRSLQDPERAISRLERRGITFNEAQQETIKLLMETGQAAKAQQIILDQVAVTFGGTARALADPITQTRNELGGLAENIGKELLPSVEAVVTPLRDMIRIVNQYPVLTKAAAATLTLGAAITGLVTVMALGGIAFLKMKAQVTALAVTMGIATKSVGLLTLSFKTFLAVSKAFFLSPLGLIVGAVGLVIGAVIMFRREIVASFAGAARAVVVAVGEMGNAFSAIRKIIRGVMTGSLATIREGFSDLTSAMKEGGGKAAEAFKEGYNETMARFDGERVDPEPPEIEFSGVLDAQRTYQDDSLASQEEYLSERDRLNEEYRLMDLEKEEFIETEKLRIRNQARRQELQDIARYGEQNAKAKAFWRSQEVQGLNQMFSNLETLSRSGNRKLFGIAQIAAVGKAIMNTARGITEALALGPIIGPPLAASQAAAGAVQIATIRRQTFQAKEGFSGSGSAFGESLVSTFTPREIVVPERFSEGIKKGDFSLESSKDRSKEKGGVIEHIFTFKDSFGDVIERTILDRRQIGASSV